MAAKCDVIEQLRQRVAELEAEVTDLNEDVDGVAVQLSYSEIGKRKAQEQLAASQLDNLRLRSAIDVAMDNLRSHGDNCFVSDNYEGDPGNRCNCGLDSLANYLKEALSTPTDTGPLEKYVADRLGDPVAWQGMTGHGLVISVNPPAIQPDKWTPLFALKEKQ